MFQNEDADFEFMFTYDEYKDMKRSEKIECYNYMYMLINNASIDFGMPMIALLDWLKAKYLTTENYENLQIIKDFELYHSRNLNKYGTTN